jgi:hypothetical protein
MGNPSTPRGSDMQGEGNRDADRTYREAAERHAKSGKSEAEGREAEAALEGEEGEELEKAEQVGKARANRPTGSH